MRDSGWLFKNRRPDTLILALIATAFLLCAVGTTEASAGRLPSLTVTLRVQPDAHAKVIAECAKCHLPDDISVSATPKGAKGAKTLEEKCDWGPIPKEKGKYQLACPRLTHEFQDQTIMVDAPIVPLDELKGSAGLHIWGMAETQRGRPQDPDNPDREVWAPYVILSKCRQSCELLGDLATDTEGMGSALDERLVKNSCRLKPPYPSGQVGHLELECTRAKDNQGNDQKGNVLVIMKAVVRASECAHRQAHGETGRRLLANSCACLCRRPSAASRNPRSLFRRLMARLLPFF